MPKKERLNKVIIQRDGSSWFVARLRREPDKYGGGESGRFRNLEEAFDFVRALYDKNGEQKLTALEEKLIEEREVRKCKQVTCEK